MHLNKAAFIFFGIVGVLVQIGYKPKTQFWSTCRPTHTQLVYLSLEIIY